MTKAEAAVIKSAVAWANQFGRYFAPVPKDKALARAVSALLAEREKGKEAKPRPAVLTWPKGEHTQECKCRKPARWGSHPDPTCGLCNGSGYVLKAKPKKGGRSR